MLTEQRKAELLQKIPSGRRVFKDSIVRKNLDEIDFLITNGANLDDDSEELPLSTALFLYDFNTANFLLTRGANINVQDRTGATVLHAASQSGKLNIVDFLLTRGANINLQDYFGVSALHIASGSGKLDVVKFLVEKGADVNAKDNDKQTPLYIVSGSGKLDVIKFLVEKGADVNAKDKYYMTPLHNAIILHNIKIVNRFHGISLYNNLDIVKFLVEKGADVNAKDIYNRTPLDIAEDKNNSDIVNFLTLSRARVIVDTPLLSRETYSAGEEGTMKYYEDIEKFTKRLECPMCKVNEKKIVFQCGHMSCNSCSNKVDKCPECRAPITTRDTVYYNKYLKYKNKYLALKNKL